MFLRLFPSLTLSLLFSNIFSRTPSINHSAIIACFSRIGKWFILSIRTATRISGIVGIQSLCSQLGMPSRLIVKLLAEACWTVQAWDFSTNTKFPSYACFLIFCDKTTPQYPNTCISSIATPPYTKYSYIITATQLAFTLANITFVESTISDRLSLFRKLLGRCLCCSSLIFGKAACYKLKLKVFWAVSSLIVGYWSTITAQNNSERNQPAFFHEEKRFTTTRTLGTWWDDFDYWETPRKC